MAQTDNFGNQIRDAVQNAVNSQDYSTLQSTIEQSINAAAVNIGKGLAQAQRGFERAQAEYARERQRIEQERIQEEQRVQREKQMELLFASPTGPRVRGGALLAGGIVATCLFGPMMLLYLMFGNLTSIAVVGALTAAGIGLIVAGGKELAFAQRFVKYRNLLGTRDHCDVSELALAAGRNEQAVVKDLRKMLNRSLIKQGALDDQERTLILTAEAKQYYLQSKREYEARQHQAQIAGSVGPQPDSRPLTPEARAMLAEGEAYIAKIRLSNEAIPDAEITRKIDQIEHVVRTIFQRVEERPEAANELGQLMDYYLPTTAKLLDAYRDLDSQPIQGQNIQKSKREISGALDALAVAFEKLLDQVFQEMAWDVSSDVAVLRTVLAQEGLTQNPFEKRS